MSKVGPPRHCQKGGAGHFLIGDVDDDDGSSENEQGPCLADGRRGHPRRDPPAPPTAPCHAPPSSASSGTASFPTPPSAAASALPSQRHVFNPTLAAPNRIPAARFSCPSEGIFLSCRHGLALLVTWNKAVVWEPVTDRRCSVDFPPEFGSPQGDIYLGAVLRDPPNSSTFKFKLIIVFYDYLESTLYTSVYESESGRWGEIISVAIVSNFSKPSVLVGNKIYWLVQHLAGCSFLEFDIDQQAMALIRMPEDMAVPDDSCVQALRTKDGGLGFAVVSEQRMQLWGSTGISGNVVRGVLEKTVELDQLLPLRSPSTPPSTEMERQLRINR